MLFGIVYPTYIIEKKLQKLLHAAAGVQNSKNCDKMENKTKTAGKNRDPNNKIVGSDTIVTNTT